MVIPSLSITTLSGSSSENSCLFCIPSIGILSIGISSKGIPSKGIPSIGIPSIGIPSKGIPSIGTPSYGILIISGISSSKLKFG
ncbi:MAG: hypothetical protein GX913_08705 [Clostridiales bacterium]|nr:hypothetical protein [Clostridiales bacterium]